MQRPVVIAIIVIIIVIIIVMGLLGWASGWVDFFFGDSIPTVRIHFQSISCDSLNGSANVMFKTNDLTPDLDESRHYPPRAWTTSPDVTMVSHASDAPNPLATIYDKYEFENEGLIIGTASGFFTSFDLKDNSVTERFTVYVPNICYEGEGFRTGALTEEEIEVGEISSLP